MGNEQSAGDQALAGKLDSWGDFVRAVGLANRAAAVCPCAATGRHFTFTIVSDLPNAKTADADRHPIAWRVGALVRVRVDFRKCIAEPDLPAGGDLRRDLSAPASGSWSRPAGAPLESSDAPPAPSAPPLHALSEDVVEDVELRWRGGGEAIRRSLGQSLGGGGRRQSDTPPQVYPRLLRVTGFEALRYMLYELSEAERVSAQAPDLPAGQQASDIMSSGQALRSQPSAEECSLCMHRTVDTVAGCGHSFCASCLSQWEAVPKTGGGGSCPLCRAALEEDAWELSDRPAPREAAAALLENIHAFLAANGAAGESDAALLS